MFFWLKEFFRYWLMPLPVCLVLLVTGLILLRTQRRAKLGRRFILAATIALVLFTNKFVSILLVRPLEARYAAIPELRADAVPANLAACRFVVALGSGNGNVPSLSATNELSASALARITEAVRLLRVLPQARLVVSGPAEYRDFSTHAVVLARAAESLGIAPDRITYIDQARDTEEESLAVKRIVGDAPFALVTSAWHMPRSVALFHAAGLNPLPCPTDFKARTMGWRWSDALWDVDSLERSTWAVRERIGYLWIWLRGRG